MEDKAEVMPTRSSHSILKTIITGQTRKFLKEKFGIDNLTANQEEAVRIAAQLRAAGYCCKWEKNYRMCL